MIARYKEHLKASNKQNTPKTTAMISRILMPTSSELKQIRILLTKTFDQDVMARIYCPEDGCLNIDKFEQIIYEIERISKVANRRPQHVGNDQIHKKYYHDLQSPYKLHLNY